MTLDTLHLVFSAFGVVQKIATFEKGQGFQALVQYSDAETAEQVRPTLKSTLELTENACIITSLVILRPCSFQSLICQCPCLPCMCIARLIFIWSYTGYLHTLQQHMQRADSARHQATLMGVCHYCECCKLTVTWICFAGFHTLLCVRSIILPWPCTVP